MQLMLILLLALMPCNQHPGADLRGQCMVGWKPWVCVFFGESNAVPVCRKMRSMRQGLLPLWSKQKKMKIGSLKSVGGDDRRSLTGIDRDRQQNKSNPKMLQVSAGFCAVEIISGSWIDPTREFAQDCVCRICSGAEPVLVCAFLMPQHHIATILMCMAHVDRHRSCKCSGSF